MKLARVLKDGRVLPVVIEDTTVFPVNSFTEKGLDHIIANLASFRIWFEEHRKRLQPLSSNNQKFLAPLKNPGKIWGIGLNYQDHASDLDEISPDIYPASFMKPKTSIIGPGEEITIPKLSERTTGEGELGIVIGKEAKNIEEEDYYDYIAGFTTIIDMTAEDILRKNPRYLTLSKSFDTFFSFGPHIITPDEFSKEEILELEVATVLNGVVYATNIVANMSFSPDKLVSFHSQVMTLQPGDIISTGTPGAALLKNGDIIECHIDGFDPLTNPVVDLKVRK